ncbi:MAG: DNA polymerase IV [Herpetosiphon sp.]
MTNKLIGHVAIPHFLVHVARQGTSSHLRRPLIVATGAADRARVIDASNAAYARGIQIGMSVWQARDRVPGLLVIPNSQAAAEQATRKVERILCTFSDTVVHEGLGHWHMPLYALGRHFNRAVAVAQEIRQAVQQDTGWPSSIGLGSSATIALIAARVLEEHPDVLVVLPGAEAAFLSSRPVSILPGIGPQTEDALARLGVRTIAQLCRVPEHVLLQVCGARTHLIALRARGHAPVETRPVPLRCRQEWCFEVEPCSDPRQLQAVARVLCERIGRILRRDGAAAGHITIQIQWCDGRSSSMHVALQPRRDLDTELAIAAHSVLMELLQQRRMGIQQIEIRATDIGVRQHDLFTIPTTRALNIQKACDTIKSRWGTGAILTGSLVALARRMSA